MVISIAVESVVKENFSNIKFEINESNKLNDHDQISKVREWLADSGLKASFKERLEGSLGAMKKGIRAIDYLKCLEKKGIIRTELVKAWKKIRDKSAHGRTIKPNEVQEFWSLCNKVIVLFNQLVFLTIGYTGRYTDYGEVGWNIKVFDKLTEKFDDITSSKNE